jgi:hypothetical protein
MKRKKTLKKTRAAKPPARGRAKPAAKPKGQIATKAKPAAAKPSSTKTARAKGKAAQPDMLDAMLAAGAEALKLRLDPAWHRGVKFNLGLILRFGALVDGFALSDEAEPGPVFHA